MRDVRGGCESEVTVQHVRVSRHGKGAGRPHAAFSYCVRIARTQEGKGFYGPGGPYAAFAGVNANRMLAKMQTKPDERDPAIDDLTPAEVREK